MKHKWHDEIVAWAANKTCIEVNKAGIWFGTDYPQWDDDGCKFRIKPQPKQPKYLYVYADSFYNGGDIDTRAGTRIMSQRVIDWETNYIGKIEVQDD